MANPKRRNSRTRRDKRRSHDALTQPGWSVCTSCFEPKPSHQVCPHCGSYKGRQVVEVEELD
jgi:large subunit ribosomal protein L32